MFSQLQSYNDRIAETPRNASGIKHSIYDFLFESKGYEEVTPQTEDYVRSIIQELEMENCDIQIKRMSRGATHFFGRENAFVIFPGSANYMYISEEWFNGLPDDQKRALIGHELQHIKQKHHKKILGGQLLYIALATTLYALFTQKTTHEKIGLFEGVVLSSIPVTAFITRYCEKEADLKAAQELDNTQGLINLFQYMKNLEDPQSKYLFKRCLNKFGRFVTWPLRTLLRSHPTFEDRIKYLKRLRWVQNMKK